jgi:hypothetical protein
MSSQQSAVSLTPLAGSYPTIVIQLYKLGGKAGRSLAADS